MHGLVQSVVHNAVHKIMHNLAQRTPEILVRFRMRKEYHLRRLTGMIYFRE